ncbi:hypothetical protein [Streptomyces sulfonofaciens]|uniref:hypothetical protein n=1 Tax=Streptomyces sulfonofaciens TaxID=68272 RepID=UPI001674C45A|nr:hypothetical protein [Streptomyces sulfonofaciens]
MSASALLGTPALGPFDVLGGVVLVDRSGPTAHGPLLTVPGLGATTGGVLDSRAHRVRPPRTGPPALPALAPLPAGRAPSGPAATRPGTGAVLLPGSAALAPGCALLLPAPTVSYPRRTPPAPAPAPPTGPAGVRRA